MKKLPYPIYLAIFLVVLGTICGAFLAAVNYYTKDIIEDNRMAEVIDKLKVTTPAADKFEKVPNLKNVNNVIEAYYGFVNETQTYIIYRAQTTKGYHGTIVALVSMEIATGKITGIVVTEQAETTGIGDQIVGNQFGLINTDIRSFENTFQPISGATRSSNGMRDLLNTVQAQYAQDYQG
jgi:Na+-translocating ferredoxin:NAD+ oxidoreductase RnfG subunit